MGFRFWGLGFRVPKFGILVCGVCTVVYRDYIGMYGAWGSGFRVS